MCAVNKALLIVNEATSVKAQALYDEWMDAESLLDKFAVRLGQHLARHGFGADEWTFRRYSEHRDALIVEFQQADLWNDEEAYFFINVFLSLNPSWEHRRAAEGLPPDEPPRGAAGKLLTRIEPVSPFEDSWRIVNDATLVEVLDKVCGQLGEVLPHLAGLLDRTELLGRLEEIYGGGAWRMRGWIVAERGPSEKLEQLLSERERTDPNASQTANVIRGYAETKAQPS
jgi:hypothetical protein